MVQKKPSLEAAAVKTERTSSEIGFEIAQLEADLAAALREKAAAAENQDRSGFDLAESRCTELRRSVEFLRPQHRIAAQREESAREVERARLERDRREKVEQLYERMLEESLESDRLLAEVVQRFRSVRAISVEIRRIAPENVIIRRLDVAAPFNRAARRSGLAEFLDLRHESGAGALLGDQIGVITGITDKLEELA